jgi:DNA-binding NtrC family response regulator
MITAYEDESSAFEAMMELGAYDYLGQLDVEELENKIENALQENLTQEELDEWKHQGIIFSAESKQMWEVMKTVKQAARTHSTVLILGESGTGKELIAEAIHKWSPRKNEQWIAVNCSALSESLLESELFGHVKGAYTDATSDKKGILEEANGGTIFLDEIGDMSPKLQLALLRVLEKGEIKPVGEAKIRKVNVRIITATNRDLMKEVQEGKFRYDLYVRLNQYRIDLPPLRERRADIEPLIKYFVEQNTPGNVDDLAIAPVVIKMLMDERYYWKGNVRELENIISRAVETAVAQRSKTITPAHISPYLLKALKEQEFWESEIPEAAPLQQFLTGVDTSKLSLKNLDEFLQPLREGLERRIIREALERTNWHKTDTAKLLDITRPSLNKKLEQYGDRETCPNCRQCSDRKTYHCGLYDSKV